MKAVVYRVRRVLRRAHRAGRNSLSTAGVTFDLLSERHDEVPIEGGGHAGEGVEDDSWRHLLR